MNTSKPTFVRWRILTIRIVAWLLIPMLAFLGWLCGQEYNQTLETTYVVDTKVMVVNPLIQSEDEQTRLTALGKTRDDTMLLGEAINSDEFHQKLADNAGVSPADFEIVSTATRTTRVITIRVTSSEAKTSSLAAVRIYDTIHQYLQQHQGLLYFETGILPTKPEGITLFRPGTGVDWPVAGTALGLLIGITLVAVSTRWSAQDRTAPNA